MNGHAMNSEKRCLNCGSILLKDKAICIVCGAPAEKEEAPAQSVSNTPSDDKNKTKICRTCGTTAASDKKFCATCGQRL
jgi:rRNA maturation endonuclease Nob1